MRLPSVSIGCGLFPDDLCRRGADGVLAGVGRSATDPVALGERRPSGVSLPAR